VAFRPVSLNNVDPTKPWVGLGTRLGSRSLIWAEYCRFLAKVCPLSALFDPAYTTYERSRNRPALQTAILWAASRFFRPDLESALHRHAEFLINRATNSGLVDLQTLEAIHVLVIWKEPNDRSAYMKIGIAVRMAYQLGLDTARTTALPQDEEEARSIVDAERTWISECRAQSVHEGSYADGAQYCYVRTTTTSQRPRALISSQSAI
jgi:hypothetical protein